MANDLRRVLWCFIKGDSYPFEVTAPVDTNISQLKKLVWEERKNGALCGTDAADMVLWKLKVPEPVKPTQGLAERIALRDLSQCAIKLHEAINTVLDEFPEEALVNSVHIVVERKPIVVSAVGHPIQELADLERFPDIGTPSTAAAPRKGIRIITPQEHTLDIKEVDKAIDKELNLLRGVVEKFLKNPEPPTWKPPQYVTLENHKFLTDLQIPTYANGQPSLLFHQLDVCNDNEIEKIFGSGSRAPLCICNTSGSGKTRRIMEGLTKYWGFYFVAIPDANGVGVRDLQDALDEVASYKEWTSDLSPFSSADQAARNDLNSVIASKQLQKVLAARIVVFNLFLELVKQVDGSLQEKHKRIWLLFQLSDQLDPNDLHPFVRIIRNCLRYASNDALEILVGRLSGIRAKYLLPSRFIFGLDEAQRAARLYPHSFISSTNEGKLRSIIREIVKVWTKSPIKLVVSGTGLSLADLEEAMASGVSKPAVELFHELGMFDTWEKLKPFLDCYIPASILEESKGGCQLQQRIREYLLGRYRFSVSYLEYFLSNGLKSPHRLLNEYIRGHTTCLPGYTGHPFILDEPKLDVKVEVMGFEWERLRLDPAALKEAAQIVQSHLTRGETPTFGPVTARLVEYGIAHLRRGSGGHEGQIVEPLAFLSVMKWLQTQDDVNLEANIRSRLSFQDSRRMAYEEVAVLYLLRALRYPVRFSAIFSFHGTSPIWADEMAQIVGRVNGKDEPVDVIGGAPENPGLGVVHYAANVEDVLQWLEAPDTAPAILVATNFFGPDVIARCRSSPAKSTTVCGSSLLKSTITPRKVLVVGQLKSYTDGNKDSLDAKTTSYALTSLHPDHWFKQTPSHQRQKLIDAIGNYDVLRFVGGYPLPPNLGLTADSVIQAIDAFGSNVVLASIELDAFKAHFISVDEARNVLPPIEQALRRRKRQASEMDP